MRTRRPLLPGLALAAGLAVSACGGGGTTATATSAAGGASVGASASDGSSASTAAAPASSATSRAPGVYLDYAAYTADPGAHAGNATVLFFHAPWCPDCTATDKSLLADGVPDGVTVVKVDYDSMTDLRKTYGITQQHTFVSVDADGRQLAKWSGSRSGAEIKAKAGA